jgi:DNA-binding IclR family transcriptional regulator
MPSVLPELTTLQSRSDQIALLYVPNLVGHPVRICTHWAVGAHGAELRTSPEAALRHLWCAPLGADAAGLAMLAYLGETSAVPGLEQIRRRGHAVSRTPFAQRDAIAAPFWCGSAVGGAVTLLVTRRHMAMPAKRRFYVDAVTHAAGLLSRRFQRTAQALGPADARASLPGDAGPERLPRIS